MYSKVISARGVSGTPDSSKDFMNTALDYPSNDPRDYGTSSLHLRKIAIFLYSSVILAATDVFRHHWSCLKKAQNQFSSHNSKLSE